MQAANLCDRFPLNRWVGDALRFLRKPSEEFPVWKDYWETNREAEFLRKHSWGTNKGKTVLVGTRSSWIYQIKIEAMLALGLRMEGWHPRFLLRSRRDRWARRYFQAFGFDDFVYWSDYSLNRAERSECNQAGEKLSQGNFGFTEVKEWSFEGCWIGPQILSTVSRGAREGSPDPRDPEVRAQILKWLPKTLESVRIAGEILDTVKPNLLFMMEPNYASNGPITDTAVNRGIDFIQTAQIARDDALIFRRLNRKTRREHPSSVARDTLNTVAAGNWTGVEESKLQKEFDSRYSGEWVLQARNQPSVQEYTKSNLMQTLEIDPKLKVACIFSHVLWDANLFYGEDLFEDYGDWFIQTVKAACANNRVTWLVKLHPANAWKRERQGVSGELAEEVMIRKHIGKLPSHVKLLLPDCPIKNTSLFEVLDYAVTVRGTISTELPCLGIPVFTAGTGRCHGMGFTIDSKTGQEYLDRMATIQTQERLSPEVIQRAKFHALTIFHHRPWIMKTFRAEFLRNPKGRQALDHNLRLNAASLDEIQANGDLRRWAEWASDPSKVDYLSQEI